VFEDNEQSVEDGLEAVKLARKFSAPKISLPTIHSKKQEGDRREAWRRYEISQRHWKLSLAIRDTPPPHWADNLYADTYQPPSDGWPPW
jgi:hypothetical protein